MFYRRAVMRRDREEVIHTDEPTKECIVCGDLFIVAPNAIHSLYCSTQCQKEALRARKWTRDEDIEGILYFHEEESKHDPESLSSDFIGSLLRIGKRGD